MQVRSVSPQLVEQRAHPHPHRDLGSETPAQRRSEKARSLKMESHNRNNQTKPPTSWADWIFVAFCYVVMGLMCFVPRPPFARTMLIITALLGSNILTAAVVRKLKKGRGG